MHLNSCPTPTWHPTLHHLQALSELLASHQRYWINPSVPHQEALQYLEVLNLMTVQRMCVIQCANPSDLKDWPYVTHPTCHNLITLPHNFNELYNDLTCDQCGRMILPDTHCKQRFSLASMHMHQKGIMQWLESHLATWFDTIHKPSEGIYHVIVQHQLITLIVPELCQDQHYLTTAYLRSQRVCLITIQSLSAALLPSFEGIPHINLATLIHNAQILKDTLRHMATTVHIENVRVPMITVHTQALSYNHHTAQPRWELTMQGHSVLINNIEVIPKHATTRRMIFCVLLDQFIHDYRTQYDPADHHYLSVNTIADQLETKHNISIESVEQEVRRVLNKLQESICAKLDRFLDIPIDPQSIIESKAGGGYHKQSYGYRLNPYAIVLRR